MRATIVGLLLLLSLASLIEGAALPHIDFHLAGHKASVRSILTPVVSSDHGILTSAQVNQRFKLHKRTTYICYSVLNPNGVIACTPQRCVNQAGNPVTRPCTTSNQCERPTVACPNWVPSSPS
ncbi:hypothetical protein IWZ00DRAFT_487941 [Phyllosticta capitalensis]|uniref:Uncharacterized protein n=1 Tax=Phyllosticta capitalensis TaxID=121624 RepID=A0ABR1YX71_9PEZI